MEKHSCCCGGNKGNEFEKLDAILMKYADSKGTLIPILQEVQNVYGYLSKDVLIYIAQKTQIPISQIYGVATFYSQFHLNPRGKKSCATAVLWRSIPWKTASASELR